jgi:choline dehydrogenase-like flavoprotein
MSLHATFLNGKARTCQQGCAAPLITGRAQLRPESHVSRILVANGKATGVEWTDAHGERHVELAGWIVVACGAMETPRACSCPPA